MGTALPGTCPQPVRNDGGAGAKETPVTSGSKSALSPAAPARRGCGPRGAPWGWRRGCDRPGPAGCPSGRATPPASLPLPERPLRIARPPLLRRRRGRSPAGAHAPAEGPHPTPAGSRDSRASGAGRGQRESAGRGGASREERAQGRRVVAVGEAWSLV